MMFFRCFRHSTLQQLSVRDFAANELLSKHSIFTPTSATKRHNSTGSTSKLNDRVAIVTGSTEGIGFAIAKRLAQDGAKVVVSSRKQANVTRAVEELEPLFPGRVTGLVCHVGKEDDRQKLVQHTLDKYGSIDILVSNVAVNPYFGNMMDMEESQWDKIFEVNVKAPFMLTKNVVPHMLKNDRTSEKGSIVYISSIAAYSGMAAIGAYSISKTALLGMSKNMSMELARDGIRVNLVAPGVIKTKFSDLLVKSDDDNDYFSSMTHLKRLGHSDELGGIVSFLCSPDASYITGENIAVAGGYHCSL